MPEDKRNLTTTREQVFGDVEPGTECRICGREVNDGRSKTCSDYCNNILTAVMSMLNWSSVRRQIIQRDNKTCQECGFDMRLEELARSHIHEIITKGVGGRPPSPSALEFANMDDFDWDEHYNRISSWNDKRDELQEKYGDPHERTHTLEVDHIERVADGGHPFDPANLQTLCSECHKDKTALENSQHNKTPSRGELSESLFDYTTTEN